MIRLVILCVAWMVLSAVIAYLADGAGRKLGKKRLTLFGLRPKHTAVLITTTTGAFIALLSFAALMFFSSGIRNALSRFDEIRLDNRRLTAESASLARQRNVLGGQVTQLSTDVRDAQRLTRDSRAAAQQARLETASAEKSRQGAISARDRALKDLSTQRVALASLRREYGQKQTLLVQAQDRLVSAKLEYAKQLARVESARREVARLETANRRLVSDNDKLQYEFRMASVDMKRAVADLSMKRSELAAAKVELANARRETDDARTRLTSAQARIAAVAGGDVVITRDEELARVIVPNGVEIVQARQILKDAISKAGQTVLEENHKVRGLIFPVSKPLVAVMPRSISEEVPGGSQRTVEYTPEQVQEGVAQSLADGGASAPNGVVVVVVARENAIAGDTAQVDFELYSNRMVFKEGEEIASVTVDPRYSKETIMEEMATALRDRVREEARRRGMMPGRDRSFVSLRPEQLADLLNAVKGPPDSPRQNPVTVRFMAAEDTWTAGPLSLRMQVVP